MKSSCARRRFELDDRLSAGTESFAESLTYLPQPGEFHLGPEGYLNHIRKAKEAVGIPIIASSNGATVGGWTDYAKTDRAGGSRRARMQHLFARDQSDISSAEIEQTYLDIVRAVKSVVSIPVAVKLSPFFSNLANMAKRLDALGADGLVLFNRFYQPDIDLEELELKPNVLLSTPQALRLPLTWIGILYARVRASLAATSGIHGPEDVIKLLMVGANVTMLCSTLLRNGISHVRYIEHGVSRVDGAPRVRIGSPDARQHEPAALPRSRSFRASPIHARGEEHAARDGHGQRSVENSERRLNLRLRDELFKHSLFPARKPPAPACHEPSGRIP